MTAKDKINCDVCEAWMDAYLDDELDIATAALVNAHLAQCPDCAAIYQHAGIFLKTMVENLQDFKADDDLANAVMAKIKTENKTASGITRKPVKTRSGWLSWLAPGFSAAALAMALTLYISIPVSSNRLADEVVSDHVRSLMENHLMDVASSDKHTVKPWFTGKLDFSPPVTDFAAAGYPLVGGRLDYLDHRNVAALAYRHSKHLINIFIFPEDVRDQALRKQSVRGYNIVSWTKNHMTFYAVSDMNAQELQTLAQMIWDASS